MKLGIMQPYFLPYIGYFQIISAVDKFLIYDNIEYTKKGWINRNRFLLNGKDAYFTLPLLNAPDDTHVVGRFLAKSFNRQKLLNQFRGAYSKAPNFDQIMPLLENIIKYDEKNLFRFIYYSLLEVCDYIDIKTPIHVSSKVDIDHSMKAQQKVLELCKAEGATAYINPVGGKKIYDRATFNHQGIGLKFHKAKDCAYLQFGDNFVPWLSIIDVLMFNSVERVRDMIFNNYELV